MGKIGDTYGRRKIMILSLVGAAGWLCEIFVVCLYLRSVFILLVRSDIFAGAFPTAFPLHLVWLSSILLLCGGGLNSASAYMWAMASECIAPDRRRVLNLSIDCVAYPGLTGVTPSTIYSLHFMLLS
jgi:MFS family permease